MPMHTLAIAESNGKTVAGAGLESRDIREGKVPVSRVNCFIEATKSPPI